jgi:hypothetical protein
MAFLVTQPLFELRHRIAAAIDASLAVSVEPKTALDTANALAYVNQRKSVKIVNGELVDGVALPTDEPFHNWITAGGAVIPSALLPDFILSLVAEYMNQSGLNIK